MSDFIAAFTVGCPKVSAPDGVDDVGGVFVEYDRRLKYENLAGNVTLDGTNCGTTLFIYLQYENTTDGTGDAIDPQGDKDWLENNGTSSPELTVNCNMVLPGIHPYLFDANTLEEIQLGFSASLAVLETRIAYGP